MQEGGSSSSGTSAAATVAPAAAPQGSEAWLLGEVKALASRLALRAVLRPRAAALLAEGEAQAGG